MFFFILPNYTPQNRAEKKMHDLWLRFLTEIDENTVDAAPELLANAETSAALDLVRTSAFTDSELLAYHKYWLDVSTERSALEREFNNGHAKGRVEGREEGREEEKLSSARRMKADGMSFDLIAKYTQLSISEIEKL